MADDFKKYQPTDADLSLFEKLKFDNAPRANIKSYVTSDHHHTILLEIDREIAISLLENIHGIGTVVVNVGSILKPKMVLINKYAVEIAPNLWVYNHDGKYRLTAPCDKVDEAEHVYAPRLRF